MVGEMGNCVIDGELSENRIVERSGIIGKMESWENRDFWDRAKNCGRDEDLWERTETCGIK